MTVARAFQQLEKNWKVWDNKSEYPKKQGIEVMCEFCHKYGEGQKWYLRAKNYSDDLLSDLKRRRAIIDFLSHVQYRPEGVTELAKLRAMPGFVKRVLVPYLVRRQKRLHYGQVLPIEDVERIFSFVRTIVRLPCACRYINLGTEQRFCYGLSLLPPQEAEMFKIIKEIDKSYLTGPDTSGLEELTKEEALENFRQYEKEGLCHTVWTVFTPFIGGICNCDRLDCIAMQATVTSGFPVMFRGEYVAQVNPELCQGCRQCMRVCQFGAIGYSAAKKKIVVDYLRCYGCGICRASCPEHAMYLSDRSSIPVAAKVW